uniref:Uncharacterized protein n=1 Tax=Panagrolaimus sp. ES5 TaxID=591445 RepID=A0AC34F4G1_9BILA
EMDNIERELSEVKERLNQAKDIFNAAESPEAQEEARTRMTELYVVKQTLSKTYSQQAVIRPKLMFLIVYGTPHVQITTDPEAANVINPTQNDTHPLIINTEQQPSSSRLPAATQQSSSSGTNNQIDNEENGESVYGSTVALVEKRKDSDNSDTNVY